MVRIAEGPVVEAERPGLNGTSLRPRRTPPPELGLWATGEAAERELGAR